VLAYVDGMSTTPTRPLPSISRVPQAQKFPASLCTKHSKTYPYYLLKMFPLAYCLKFKNVPLGLLFKVGVRFWFAYVLMFGNAIKNGSGWPALKGATAGAFYYLFHGIPSRFVIQRRKKVTTASINRHIWQDLPPDQTGLRNLRAKFIGK